MDPQQSQAQAMHIMAALLPLAGIFALVVLAIIIIPLWRICTKAGLAGPLALIVLFPGIGWIVLLYIIAFSEWRVVPAAAAPYYPTSYPPPPPPPTSFPPATPPSY